MITLSFLVRKGIDHSDCILQWGTRLKAFGGSKDVTAFAHLSNQRLHLVVDFLRRAELNSALTAETAPKRYLVTIFLLEFIRVHFSWFWLHTLKHIKTN